MSTQNDSEPALIDLLSKEGYRFDFFQAVRILERLEADRNTIGKDASPETESVRFASFPSVEFPASQIHGIDINQSPPRMTVMFFGLLGPLGALPQHYTEAIIERVARKDRAMLDFFNLFNHRLISLFYRAWEKYQFWIASERTFVQERRERNTGEDHFRAFVLNERPRLDPVGQILLDLCGLGTSATRYVTSQRDRLESRTEIDDETWRFYAGILSQRHRCAISLEIMLEDHFRMPVRVQPLCGRWLQLEDEDRTCLRKGSNTELGRNTVAGRKVWEVQGKIRLSVGPLGYTQFCSLLPIGTAHRTMAQFVRFYVGQNLDFDLDLQLRTEEIPSLHCGVSSGIGPRLGWNTWLKTRRFNSASASVVLRSYDDVAS